MHGSQLAQLACCLVTQGPVFLRTAGSLPATVLDTYWTASKSRIDRWLPVLKHLREDLQTGLPPERGAAWQSALPTLEEVLQSEVLTRLWAALGCMIDRRLGAVEIEPVLRSVLLGHGEARNRVLGGIIAAQPHAPDSAVGVNALRRKLNGGRTPCSRCCRGRTRVPTT
jgi:hypothetical protein